MNIREIIVGEWYWCEYIEEGCEDEIVQEQVMMIDRGWVSVRNKYGSACVNPDQLLAEAPPEDVTFFDRLKAILWWPTNMASEW